MRAFNSQMSEVEGQLQGHQLRDRVRKLESFLNIRVPIHFKVYQHFRDTRRRGYGLCPWTRCPAVDVSSKEKIIFADCHKIIIQARPRRVWFFQYKVHKSHGNRLAR